MEEDTMKASEAHEASTQSVPEWAVPARRSDLIGQLAWQLVGEPEEMGDYTAAGRLYDALMDAGETQQAINLKRELCRLAAGVGGPAAHGREVLQRMLEDRAERTRDSVSHLLYDFDSVMGVLARAVELCNQPEEAPKEDVREARFIDANVGYRARGDRVELPDGRHGIVVAARDASGRCRILLD